MSAALKDRDWSHTSRENNPSFPLELLLEGLIKEEKQLWLSERSSCAVAQFHVLGFLIRAWEVPPAFSSAFGCLAGKFPSLLGAGVSWRVCVFPGGSVGITLGQMFAGFSFQGLFFFVRKDVVKVLSLLSCWDGHTWSPSAEKSSPLVSLGSLYKTRVSEELVIGF